MIEPDSSWLTLWNKPDTPEDRRGCRGGLGAFCVFAIQASSGEFPQIVRLITNNRTTAEQRRSSLKLKFVCSFSIPYFHYYHKKVYIYQVATLYIIGTPIGNLGDISFRAVEALKNVDLVACEDTRRTLKLLNHLGIRKKMLSCRSQNEEFAAQKVIEALNEGLTAAYASDAGTPCLSDPGAALVRLAAGAGHEIIPIPGPSAFASLVSVAGGTDKTIVFEGFLSPKPGRRKSRLRELLALDAAVVLYESPFRILKLLEDIAEIDGSRYICIGREMTKIHEEYKRGTVMEIFAEFSQKKEQIGEFSVYIAGNKSK